MAEEDRSDAKDRAGELDAMPPLPPGVRLVRTLRGHEDGISKLVLLLPPGVAAVVDAVVTLQGQTDAYWSGGREAIEELNPIGYYSLSASPLVFIAGIFLWIVVFSCILLIAPYRIAKWISLAICLLHLFGASTWIVQLRYGVAWVILLCIAVRIVLQPIYFTRTAT